MTHAVAASPAGHRPTTDSRAGAVALLHGGVTVRHLHKNGRDFPMTYWFAVAARCPVELDDAPVAVGPVVRFDVRDLPGFLDTPTRSAGAEWDAMIDAMQRAIDAGQLTAEGAVCVPLDRAGSPARG